jgi:hypothetical protein
MKGLVDLLYVLISCNDHFHVHAKFHPHGQLHHALVCSNAHVNALGLAIAMVK